MNKVILKTCLSQEFFRRADMRRNEGEREWTFEEDATRFFSHLSEEDFEKLGQFYREVSRETERVIISLNGGRCRGHS